MNDCTPDCASPFRAMLYFLVGGVTGASAALLLAPRSGTATREKVRRKLRDTAASARDLEQQLIRGGQMIGVEARHRVDDAVAALAGDGEPKLAG